MQFAINASLDTLATNANLKRWGKRTNAKCDLCKKRERLHHTLNNCDIMLDRYSWRHDSILNFMYTTIKDKLQSDNNVTVFADLPFAHEGNTTLPIDIIITAQKPDLVIIDRNKRNIILFELSVPFELNIDSTHELKVNRYSKLVSDIESSGYTVDYYPVEIGSRGYISKDNEARLKSLFRKVSKDIKYNLVKQNLCKIALLGSFVIYHSKYEDSWLNPRYISV